MALLGSWVTVLPFLMYAVAHGLLLASQVSNWSSAKLIITAPLAIVTGGCLTDNLRLFLGLSRVGRVLTHASYFLHLVALPPLILSLLELYKTYTTLPAFVDALVYLIVVGLSLDGWLMYRHDVQTKVIAISGGNYSRYGLLKVPPRFLLGVVAVSIGLIALGLQIYRNTTKHWTLVLQLTCFLLQAAAPALVPKEWMLQVMNIFEVIVIWNIVTLASSMV